MVNMLQQSIGVDANLKNKRKFTKERKQASMVWETLVNDWQISEHPIYFTRHFINLATVTTTTTKSYYKENGS